LYSGSCHCGAVTMALKNRGAAIQEIAPLAEEIGPEVIGECDCSICARVRRSFPSSTLSRANSMISAVSSLADQIS
jgi:hypothetical protein